MKDAVARLTPLGVMVLALLREDDMHPYEMIRLLRHRRGDRFVAITNGTLYHTVARLQRAELLAEVGIDREGNRPERTTYTLTDAGDAAVVEWVRRELPRCGRPTEFRVALAEMHNLPPAEAVELLTARRALLAESREAHRGGLAGALAKGTPPIYLVELAREDALLDAELSWLDGLLDRIRRGELRWDLAADMTDARYRAQREAARR
ncbi:PadR family transcriptional regulator [Microbacterium aurum]|uniref:PadR family transcriptional regulator n=1 Tax=Microbacterium aurum TaxID=36805 RepID=UPI0028F0AE85|nr:PadR family transcriptional regulator [Microbacterium aurum]